MRKFKTLRGFAAGVVAMSLIAACGSDDDGGSAPETTSAGTTATTSGGSATTSGGGTATTAADTTTAPEPCEAPAKVRIGDIRGASQSAIYAALGTGIITQIEKDCDTEFEIVQFGSGNDSVNGLMGGAVDVTVAHPSAFIKAQAAGRDVTAGFIPLIGGGIVILAAKKYEAERGTDFSKFDGATFGFTAEGTTTELFQQAAVEAAGLSWEAQKKIAFGQTAAGLPTLESGRADVVGSDPLTAAAIVDAGVGYVMLNTSDEATAGPIIGEQIGAVVVWLGEFGTKYPVLEAKIADAYKQGLEAVRKAGDASTVLALFPADIRESMKDSFAAQYRYMSPAILATDGTAPQSAIDDSVALYTKIGQLTKEEAEAGVKIFDNPYTGS